MARMEDAQMLHHHCVLRNRVLAAALRGVYVEVTLLVPDGGHYSSSELGYCKFPTLLFRGNQSRLNITLPNSNRLVVLVSNSNHIPSFVDGELTWQVPARRGILHKVQSSVLVDRPGRERVRRAGLVELGAAE